MVGRSLSDAPLIQLFMPWFFHCWTPDPHATGVENEALEGMIPTAAYLAAKGRRLDPLLRRYLESLLSAPFTFFEVVSCDPGAKMTLRDLLTRQEHVVTERSASQAVKRGDLLFGQVALIEGLTMFEAFNGYAIPPIEKALVIDLRARVARGIRRSPSTSCGSTISNCSISFTKSTIASSTRRCRCCRTPMATRLCSTSLSSISKFHRKPHSTR